MPRFDEREELLGHVSNNQEFIELQGCNFFLCVRGVHLNSTIATLPSRIAWCVVGAHRSSVFSSLCSLWQSKRGRWLEWLKWSATGSELGQAFSYLISVLNKLLFSQTVIFLFCAYSSLQSPPHPPAFLICCSTVITLKPLKAQWWWPGLGQIWDARV